MGQLGDLQARFIENPLAAMVAAELLAIVTLFALLVRSYNARIQSSERLAGALVKMEELHRQTVVVLERFAKQRRRAPDVAQRAPETGGAE